MPASSSMTLRRLTKNEAGLLAFFLLLAVLFGVIPWREVARRHTETQASKYGFSAVPNSKKSRSTPATWRLDTHYSPTDGTLELRLSHRYNRPTNDITLVAEFRSEPLAEPSASTVLRRQPGGAYRSENLRLSRGSWVMSVTGVQQSTFKFRIEQPLRVK